MIINQEGLIMKKTLIIVLAVLLTLFAGSVVSAEELPLTTGTSEFGLILTYDFSELETDSGSYDLSSNTGGIEYGFFVADNHELGANFTINNFSVDGDAFMRLPLLSASYSFYLPAISDKTVSCIGAHASYGVGAEFDGADIDIYGFGIFLGFKWFVNKTTAITFKPAYSIKEIDVDGSSETADFDGFSVTFGISVFM
jgi:hypothetical protein